MNLDDLSTLVAAIARKDMATAAHTWRVVLYAKAMAEAGGLDHELVTRITHGAALHDIGKLTTPDEVLQKPGPLSEAERVVMQRHAADGAAMLVAAGEHDELVLGLVKHHHERMDGTGYPDGLSGSRIPVAARYFSVIDSFDAMTSVRAYRASVGPAAAERALQDLRAHRGTWYCAESVDMFEALYRRGELSWITEYSNDACPLPIVRGRATPAPSPAPARGGPAT